LKPFLLNAAGAPLHVRIRIISLQTPTTRFHLICERKPREYIIRELSQEFL